MFLYWKLRFWRLPEFDFAALRLDDAWGGREGGLQLANVLQLSTLRLTRPSPVWDRSCSSRGHGTPLALAPTFTWDTCKRSPKDAPAFHLDKMGGLLIRDFIRKDSPVFGLLASLEGDGYVRRRNCKLAIYLLNSLATIQSLNKENTCNIHETWNCVVVENFAKNSNLVLNWLEVK